MNDQYWKNLIEESKQYKPCASLWIDKESERIELYLDTNISTYSEWIKNEGSDISLKRCQETNKVVGVSLPLYQTDFVISYTDGIRVKLNGGFKDEV